MKERRGAESMKDLLGRPGSSSSPGHPTKKKKITKNLLSIDQVSYALASCNHSSLPSNQCGSSSYMSSHEPITVKVYMSQEQHHPSLALNISNTSSKPSRTPIASSDKMAQLYSLSMRDLLAQAHHLLGLPSFKSNLPD